MPNLFHVEWRHQAGAWTRVATWWEYPDGHIQIRRTGNLMEAP